MKNLADMYDRTFGTEIPCSWLELFGKYNGIALTSNKLELLAYIACHEDEFMYMDKLARRFAVDELDIDTWLIQLCGMGFINYGDYYTDKGKTCLSITVNHDFIQAELQRRK